MLLGSLQRRPVCYMEGNSSCAASTNKLYDLFPSSNSGNSNRQVQSTLDLPLLFEPQRELFCFRRFDSSCDTLTVSAGIERRVLLCQIAVPWVMTEKDDWKRGFMRCTRQSVLQTVVDQATSIDRVCDLQHSSEHVSLDYQTSLLPGMTHLRLRFLWWNGEVGIGLARILHWDESTSEKGPLEY